MAKCPHCGKDIDYLNYESVTTQAGTVSLGGIGNQVWYDVEHTDTESHYNCPHCDEELATDESTAKSILKGEGEHEDRNRPSETPHPD